MSSLLYPKQPSKQPIRRLSLTLTQRSMLKLQLRRGGTIPLLEESFTSSMIAPRAEQNYTNPQMSIKVQIIVPDGGKLHYFEVVDIT